MLVGVFGTGRNGSTLITRLLDGLEGTYVHPVEERFLTSFDDLARRGRISRLVQQNCVSRPLRALDVSLDRDRLTPAFEGSLDEFFTQCEAVAGRDDAVERVGLSGLLSTGSYRPEAFVRAYLESLARIARPDLRFDHYLFKSIETPYIADYEARFPDMRFVHIVRHPVAVCSSQKMTLFERKGLPASYMGYDWLACMLNKRWLPHARFIAEHRNDPRHVVVRYEDLVKDPNGEIERVAGFLGLAPPLHPDRVTLFGGRTREDWGANPSKKGVSMPATVVPDLQSRAGYGEILTRREIDVIAVKTRSLLGVLGYECPSDVGRLRAAVQYLPIDRWEWANCRSQGYVMRGLFGMFYRRGALL